MHKRQQHPHSQQTTEDKAMQIQSFTKIHPVIFYKLAAITGIAPQVYGKGAEEWHSISSQCWQPFTATVGSRNFPMGCYLPVGGPVGKLSGRVQQGTNENRRSCPGRTSGMSVRVKALELRFGETVEEQIWTQGDSISKGHFPY